jgi:hypothetical protein
MDSWFLSASTGSDGGFAGFWFGVATGALLAEPDDFPRLTAICFLDVVYCSTKN